MMLMRDLARPLLPREAAARLVHDADDAGLPGHQWCESRTNHTMILAFYRKLMASFHACQYCSPWPSWRPRAVAGCDAVSKIRGTSRQLGGWHAHDHCLLCSCAPEMYAPHIHALAPHVARGEADQQHSQPVREKNNG